MSINSSKSELCLDEVSLVEVKGASESETTFLSFPVRSRETVLIRELHPTGCNEAKLVVVSQGLLDTAADHAVA